MRDPRNVGDAHAPDDLAEALAEEFLESATSAEEVQEDVRDEVTLEELGGPFVDEELEEVKGADLQKVTRRRQWG